MKHYADWLQQNHPDSLDLTTEDFNNVSDFLLNPQHRNKTWTELMDEFQASGGKQLGQGKYGTILSHPNWPYVLKIFNDPHYLRFVRFATRSPHPSFPKFYGTAQKIIPFYRRSKNDAIAYIVRMEPLQEVHDPEMLKEIRLNYMGAIQYFAAARRGRGEENQEYEQEIMPSFRERRQGALPKIVKRKVFQDILDLFQKYPQSKNLLEGIFLVSYGTKNSALDIHDGNIMQRANGDLVLIDPLWEGSNPYRDYARAMELELDQHPEPEPEDLMGGQLPKRKRVKRYKSPTNIPF